MVSRSFEAIGIELVVHDGANLCFNTKDTTRAVSHRSKMLGDRSRFKTYQIVVRSKTKPGKTSSPDKVIGAAKVSVSVPIR